MRGLTIQRQPGGRNPLRSGVCLSRGPIPGAAARFGSLDAGHTATLPRKCGATATCLASADTTGGSPVSCSVPRRALFSNGQSSKGDHYASQSDCICSAGTVDLTHPSDASCSTCSATPGERIDRPKEGEEAASGVTCGQLFGGWAFVFYWPATPPQPKMAPMESGRMQRMLSPDAVFLHQPVQRHAGHRQFARRHAHVEAVAGDGRADGIRLGAFARFFQGLA